MIKFKIEKVPVSPPRKLKATWTVEPAMDWFQKGPYDEAFNNFFHNWVMNKADYAHSNWGPEVWEPWGFTVKNSDITIVDEQKFTLFLLRWA